MVASIILAVMLIPKQDLYVCNLNWVHKNPTDKIVICEYICKAYKEAFVWHEEAPTQEGCKLTKRMYKV
jgi:PIN domain nuclease of toxin-antitoxin system